MNLHHLQYFIRLAHIEHYTKASEDLMITQPSLSYAISSLEQELGVQLFEKEGRNVVLTKTGKIFLDYVEQAMQLFDEGVEKVQKEGLGEGRIDLAFLETLGTNLVPDITRKFLEANTGKDIQFHFHTGVTTEIIQGLKEKKYDMAFCSKQENEQTIEFVPFARQDLVVIAPPDHPLSVKDEVDLIDTIPYPQIVFAKTSGLRPLIDSLFQKIGAEYQAVYEVEVDQVIAGLVSKGFGIAVVPYMPILRFLNVKVLKLGSPNWERKFYLAYLKKNYLTPVSNDFITFAKEHHMLG
ncbi:LysR family transcriptional regulator [Listeria ilorinensis]|uniref:LysR family transcriptional regulator n=1 Tax=Listeria ilorinensis TaxID=2867439 RepID=UPI001EF63FA7|nr:LysR family transcriptional regulator [Listeria ilorinensis]